MILSSLQAEPRWIVMRSENFEVYSSAGERATRETLQHFERVRGFFEQASPGTSQPEFLIRVVVVSDRKEYEALRPNNFAIAYYLSGRLREYIVIGNAAVQAFPVAVHEYVHLLARQAGLNYPPWLNEGLAELYSTLKPYGGKIMVGDIINGRMQALQSEKWPPLKEILEAAKDSPYYNEKDRAGKLYNIGWALTHMLSLSDDYRRGFGDVMKLIQAGTASEAALAKVYGKDLKQIEGDLERYVRRATLRAVLFDASLSKLTEKPEPVALDDFEVRMMKAELGEPGRAAKESLRVYEALSAENPKQAGAKTLLAYAQYREGLRPEAAASFKTAFELGERNPKVLWDFGRIAAGTDLELADAALSELLKAQPNRVEVRTELAWVKLRSNQGKQALETLAPVRQVRPAEAVRFFEVAALVNQQLGNRDEAVAAAGRMRKVAKEEADIARAEKLVKWLEAAGPTGKVAIRPLAAQPEEERPRLAQRRQEVIAATSLETKKEIVVPPQPELRGVLVGMDCGSKPPSLSVEAAGKVESVFVDRPEQTVVIGVGGGKVDLRCGAQRPRRVRVAYEEAAGGKKTVRILEFLE